MPPAKRPPKPEAPPSRRKKSKLTTAGDRAKWETERALLLKTLRAKGWNLTHTADELDMGSPTAVLHALDRYELREDYEKARDAKG